MRSAGRWLIASLALGFFPPAVWAADGGAWTVGRGEWFSEVSGTRMSANASFLEDGRDVALDGGLRIQSRTVTSYNEIGWKKNVSVALTLPFEDLTYSAGRDEATVSGLSDLRAALRFRLREGAPSLVLDVGWKAPLGYEKRLVPSLGNGRQEAFGDFYGGFSLPWLPGFVQASRGFNFVGEDGLLIATTNADLAGWCGSRVLIGMRYSDATIISSESNVYDMSAAYSAGPVVLVRVDDRLDVSGGSWFTWFGRNALRSNEVYLAVAFKQSKLNRLQGFLGTSQRP